MGLMINDQKFQEYYRLLNKSQKQAVDTIEGPVMVVAGPGTGKTQILTLRIANILRLSDTKPEQVLALTFTKSGTNEMRRRLTEIVGPMAYSVNLHTFHGFCEEIIKRFPEEFPNLINRKSVSDVKQVEILSTCLQEVGGNLKSFIDPLFYLKSVLTEINNLKRENISPLDFKVIAKDMETTFLANPDLYNQKGKYVGLMKSKYQTASKKIARNLDLALVYEKYEKALAVEKLYDYADMILMVVNRLTENLDFRLEVQEEYQYILADEHQDANGAQNRLLELLADYHEQPNLFIVGDEKQAIYQFQGASLDNFDHFLKLYPETKVIALSFNYRSRQAVLDPAFDLIKNSTDLPSERLTPLEAQTGDKKTSPAIVVRQFNHLESENHYVASKIKQLLTEDKISTIAVLYRNNKHITDLLPELDQLDITYELKADTNILADYEINKFLIILRAIVDLNNEPDLVQAMHFSIFNLPRLAIYEWLAEAKKRNLSLAKLNLMTDFESTEIKTWWNKMITWNELAHNDLLLPVLHQLLTETKLVESWLSLPQAYLKISYLKRLIKEAESLVREKPEAKLVDFLNHLDLIIKHNITLTTDEVKPIGSRLKLMTTHRAKGLEFDYVFIIKAVDGHFGNRREINYFDIPKRGSDKIKIDRLADDRRLFFVALTRAKTEVNISYALIDETGRERLPTRFITEIKSDLLFFEDMAKVEETYVKDLDFNLKLNTSNSNLSQIEIDYWRQVFLSRPLSVTALNNYLTCPAQYFFRNLMQLPEPAKRHLLFGQAIHGALEQLFRQAKKTDKLPTKVSLLKSFEHNLKNLPLTSVDRQELLTKGQTILDGYYKTWAKTWSLNVLVEQKVIIPDFYKDVSLVGKLDKVEFTESGLVTVVDYKTGKPKTRGEIEGKTKNSTGNLKRQLTFYKLLLDLADRNFDFGLGRLDFVEPDQKGRYVREDFEITDNEVAELKATIEKMITEVLANSFWSNPCLQKDCDYCRLKKLLF